MSHPFQLRSAYSNELPYTNYTYDFTGNIDYIWYPSRHIRPVAVLGPVDPVSTAFTDVSLTYDHRST